EGCMIIMKSQANLLEVILTFGPRGRFPNPLYGRQQQADEQGDNGDDNEQFNESEPVASICHGRSPYYEPSAWLYYVITLNCVVNTNRMSFSPDRPDRHQRR